MGKKYGVVASLNLLGKSLKLYKKHFLTKFLQVKKSPSLRRDHFPMRLWSWKGGLNTCLRFKKVPHIGFEPLLPCRCEGLFWTLSMLEPIPLSTIRTIASMWLSSHALRCETERWGTSDDSARLCTLFPKQVRESQYHTLIQCCALIIFNHAFHTSSTNPNPWTNFVDNYNVHSRLQHSLVKFLNIKSHYSLSHVSREV